VLSPIGTRAIRSPLLRVPAEALLFTFNLVRFPTTDDAGEVSRLVEANRAIYGRVRDAGGTLYPVSALPLSRDGWREHFGPAFARLERVKRRFDPGAILTPGYPIFDPAPGHGGARG
jgi:cytokinin dehydrogenase